MIDCIRDSHKLIMIGGKMPRMVINVADNCEDRRLCGAILPRRPLVQSALEESAQEARNIESSLVQLPVQLRISPIMLCIPKHQK